jgi:site-specific DNA recombinase
MKRAVLYARVSGDDRRYATSSVDAQLVDCREYAANNDYKIVGEYYEERDKQTSGTDWLPELNRILKMAAQGSFDVLIVSKMDRLARNRFKQMSVEIDLSRHGIAVEYAKEQFKDTAEGRLLKGMMGEFAEFEREKIKERMVGGMLRSVENGNVKISNRPPYGYKVIEKDGKRLLAIVDAEANVIRIIFDLYVNQNYTIYAIAKYLDDHKISKPESRAKGWSHGTIRNILTNETYIGRWYYGKTKFEKDLITGKKKRGKQPKSEWLLVEVPPILSDDIFTAAQKRRKSNKRRGKQRKNIYALGGMLTCGHCGNGMSGITRNDRGGKQYYVCNIRHGKGRYTSAEPCDNPYYNVPNVDSAVWLWVKSILLSPEKLRHELEKYQQERTVEFQPLIDMLASSEQNLSELHGEKERLIKAYSAGILTLDEIAIQKTELDKRIKDLTQAINELRAELQPKLLSKKERKSIEEIAEQVRVGADLTDDNTEAQREIFHLLQMKVTLSESEGKRWADVTCILGTTNVPAAYSANDFAAP